MQPNTINDWMNLSRERQSDASALLRSRRKSIAPVYIVGYAIETALKAYLKSRNFQFPRSGREGHNLTGLWRRAGFRSSDLKDSTGHKSFFINEWGTHLRYETSLDQKQDSESLIKAAGQLVGWITIQIRREKRKRGR